MPRYLIPRELFGTNLLGYLQEKREQMRQVEQQRAMKQQQMQNQPPPPQATIDTSAILTDADLEKMRPDILNDTGPTPAAGTPCHPGTLPVSGFPGPGQGPRMGAPGQPGPGQPGPGQPGPGQPEQPPR